MILYVVNLVEEFAPIGFRDPRQPGLVPGRRRVRENLVPVLPDILSNTQRPVE